LDMLALGALESPQIGTAGTAFDLSELHAALAVGAARPFNGKQRWVRTIMSFGHVMHPGEGGSAEYSQSPMMPT